MLSELEHLTMIFWTATDSESEKYPGVNHLNCRGESRMNVIVEDGVLIANFLMITFSPNC